jgi:hypothetical protein
MVGIGERAMMDNLILRTRLDILKTNLRRVKEVDSVEELRADLQTVLNLPTDPRLVDPLGEIADLSFYAKRGLRDRNSDRVMQCLIAIEQQLEAVQRVLAEVAQSTESVQARALPIRRGKAWPALQEGLVDKAQEQITAIDKINQELLEPASREPDPDAALELTKQAWKRISEKVYGKSQSVFTEYLDFLSGLALRDTGFDRGICRIADELIRSSSRLPENFMWDSLTIPAQQGALRATLAKIVRLGFPEWTIWALPLAAHEFGHVAATIRRIDAFITDHASTDEARHHLRMCLADAFATYVIGPAYPCAVILIRLDPLTAFSEDDQHLTEKRARVVLSMLRHMSKAPAPTEPGPYTEILSRLEEQWDEALRQAGWDCMLSPEERAEVEGWVQLISTTMGDHRALPAKAWPRISELADSLDAEGVNHVMLELDDEVRLVLNAAWKRRLDDDDLRKVDDVAKAALVLWERIDRSSQGGGKDNRLPPLSGAAFGGAPSSIPKLDLTGRADLGGTP